MGFRERTVRMPLRTALPCEVVTDEERQGSEAEKSLPFQVPRVGGKEQQFGGMLSQVSTVYYNVK